MSPWRYRESVNTFLSFWLLNSNCWITMTSAKASSGELQRSDNSAYKLSYPISQHLSLHTKFQAVTHSILKRSWVVGTRHFSSSAWACFGVTHTSIRSWPESCVRPGGGYVHFQSGAGKLDHMGPYLQFLSQGPVCSLIIIVDAALSLLGPLPPPLPEQGLQLPLVRHTHSCTHAHMHHCPCLTCSRLGTSLSF